MRTYSARVFSIVKTCREAQGELYFYLIHVRLDQNLTYKGLCISCLVDGGVCPQTVTYHVHIGCLQAFNQQALQRLLQHGGDPCNTLAENRILNWLVIKRVQKNMF